MAGRRGWHGPVLSAVVRAELERLARSNPASLARRARAVLARADNISLNTIANDLGMHRDSVRRWVVRFTQQGFAGLQHGNAGKPKNVIFTPETCREIARRANMAPSEFGEPFASWSLYKLRDHLVRQGVVRTISVERLRQLLRGVPVEKRHWHRPSFPIGPLAPEVRHQLVELLRHPHNEQVQRARAVLAVADGTSIQEVASRMRLDRSHLRRWLTHFRVAGPAGLRTPPQPPPQKAVAPAIREAVLGLLRTEPRRVGEPGERWSVEQLRTALTRLGVVSHLSIEDLQRIVQALGVTLPHTIANGQPTPSAPAVLASDSTPRRFPG